MKPLQLITRYTRKFAPQLILTVFSMVLLVGVQLLVPQIIRTLISQVSAIEKNPAFLDLLTALALGALGLFILRGILTFIRSYQAHIAGWGVVASLRKHLYEHLQRLSLRFYENKQIGELMSQLTNDAELFEQLISHALPDVFVNILTLIGVILVLVFINWKLLLLALIPVPLILIALRIYARVVRPAFRFRQKTLSDLNALLNENIAGIKEIKAFTREPEESRRVDVRIENYRNALLKALRLMAIFQPFIEFSSSLGQLVVIFFGGLLAFNGEMPVSDLVAFFLYLEILYQPIRNLSGAWENVQGALAGADRITDVLDENVEAQDQQKHISLPENVTGRIEFKNLTFAYNPSENVLEGVSLDIPAHKIIALVGPTGVGKTTLVSLIPRFYEQQQGAIELDGIDIRQIEMESLRQQISMVLQDVYLFYGTVRENILFGKPDADEREMISAAAAANAHEFILQLPEGYDTMVGERGVKLSGGQKQRISIARAILKNAPILILDEATSSVDTETEVQIQEALERLMKGKTTIIIAHRLSTVRNADTIVVLEGKGIREMGSHRELIARNGLYKRLYTVQQRMSEDGGTLL